MQTELRPHHLLCVQKFTGLGYDDTFTAHMYHLLWKLKGKPQIPVKMIEGGDMLCAVCPNRNDARCVSHDKVRRMDEEVLSACDLKYGSTGSWQELSGRAEDLILNTEIFEQICGSCQWIELCRNTKTTENR